MAVMVSLWQKINSNNSGEFVLIRPEIIIVVIKNFLPSPQPFLGCHLDFTTFSSWPSCVGLSDWATPFLQLEWLFEWLAFKQLA